MIPCSAPRLLQTFVRRGISFPVALAVVSAVEVEGLLQLQQQVASAAELASRAFVSDSELLALGEFSDEALGAGDDNNPGVNASDGFHRSLRCGDSFDIQASQTFKVARGKTKGHPVVTSHEACAVSRRTLTKQPGTYDDMSASGLIMQPRPKHHWIVFSIVASAILGASLILLALYNSAADSIEQITGIKCQHVCCLTFMVLSLSIDISMKSAAKADGGRYNFDPAVAVLIVELCKLIISAFLVVSVEMPRMRMGLAITYPSRRDCAWLAVPGFVYTATNIIAYEAIEDIPLATFSVVRETRLFWNAILWVLIFRHNISKGKWTGVFGIFLGCTVSQIPAMVKSDFSPAITWVIVLAFLTAAGGVMTEYAMKQKASLDINQQSCVLYLASSCFTMLFLVVTRRHLFVSTAAFFHGFEPECMQIIVLQVLQGLTVSRILKHVESVTKSIVSSMCSPLLTFIGSAIMRYHLRVYEIFAALLVLLSCCLYLKDGPLTSPNKDIDAASRYKLLVSMATARRMTI